MAHERSRSYYSELEVTTPNGMETVSSENGGLEAIHRDSRIYYGGLEAVPQVEGKIAHTPDEEPGKKLLGSDFTNDNRPPSYQTHVQGGNAQEPIHPGRRLKPWQIALIVLGIIGFLGLVVAVPVAVTQTRKNSSPTPSSPTTSTSGAMNSTGLVVSNPGNGVDNLWLFYQDYTGDLHRTIYSGGSWQKGISLGLKNAANGTGTAMMVFPLDSNSTLQSTSSIVHIAYVGTDLLLHDALLNTSSTNTSASSPFTPGLLSASNFSVADPSASHMAFALDAFNRTSLFASGPDGLIHEYLWDPTLPSPFWNDTFTFPTLSGYASPGPGVSLTTVTLHGVNPFSGQLQLWYKSVNVNSSGTWNQGATTAAGNIGAGDGVWRNTSVVVGDGQMAFLGNDGEVDLIGYTGTMAAERWGGVTDTGIKAMQGSSVAGVGASKGITDLFAQVNGSDVVHFVGGGGSWGVEEALPV